MKTKTIIRWIRENKTIIFVILSLIVIIVPYVLMFGKNGLSDCTSDWAAFGSYIGGAVAIISILLVYKTYRDQSIANQRRFFENSLRKKTDSLKSQLREIGDDIKCLSKDLLKPFMPISTEKPKEEYSIKCYEKALRRCYKYYTMNRDRCEGLETESFKRNSKHIKEIEGLIRYVSEVLSFIHKFPLIDNQYIYVSDTKNLLSEDLKVVMFYYVVSKAENDLFHIFKESDIFNWRNMENQLFLWVVELISKNKNITTVSSFDENSMMLDNGKDELVESNNFLHMVNEINNGNLAHKS